MPQFHPSFLFLLLFLVAMEGWAFTPPTTVQPLRIGVPGDSPCPKYVKVKCNQTSNKCFHGYSILLFKLILKRIHYKRPYQFFPYNGSSYDSLVEQVSLKNFDAVVGDVSIVANRTQYVDFSRPYTRTGVRIMMLEKPEAGKAWMFVKPFTKSMWALTIAIFLYNGLIVWLIEKEGDEELKSSSFSSQFGSLVWLSVTALFPIHAKELRSNLSRVAMVVWLVVALVLIQSYAANLTAMLTVTQLRPTPLLRSTDYVGCDHGSFAINYLENVLHIDKSRIKTYMSGEDYAKALRSGEIKAAFLELAFIKIFLDENKKGFAVTGPTYEIGGYGYAFSKGSPLVENVSDEILRLRESRELRELEDRFLVPSSESSSSDSGGQESARLSPDSFWGLFLITFGTSTLEFLLFLVSRFYNNWCLKKQHKDEQAPEKDDAANLTPEKDDAANLTPSERAPHTVTGVVVHDPDCWHDEIQKPKFRRCNTC